MSVGYDNMYTTLLKLGLSEKEAKVYLAALELAQDTAQNIAKKAGVNRPTTYVILEKLMKLGLISMLERGKKTMFVAENPRELSNLLDKESQALRHKKNELDEIMNQLLALYSSRSDKPAVRYFEGPDGLEAMDRYGRERSDSKEILSISPIDVVEQYFGTRRKKSVGERVKMGIRSRTIYTREKGDFTAEENRSQLRTGARIPRARYPLNATFTIYPEWGIKMYYYDEDRPYGVIIESADLAHNMKLFFELAWIGAKQKKN
jgi:sugar-specific transcriptional regulator TrmB